MQAEEQTDPWLWVKVFGVLSIAFFFTGWTVGAVIEHNSCVADVRGIFLQLRPENYDKVNTSPELQAMIDKYNITEIKVWEYEGR